MDTDSDKLFIVANTINVLKYPMGYKYGQDVMYHLHEANNYIMKAALEIYNSEKKETNL